MFLIDTNIFLEILLARKNKNSCKKFLKKVHTGDIQGIVSKFSLYSIEILLTSLNKMKELNLFLSSLLKSQGLIIKTTTITDELQILALMKKYNLDFDDAIQFYIAIKNNVKNIVSFDKHFNNLSIKRIEPVQVI